VNRGDPVELARQLVRIDSRNPSLAPGAPGEAEVARLLASVLEEWGCSVQMMETDLSAQRPNVVARVGRPNGRTLMFNGHMDVVGTEGMIHAPFDAFEKSGRLYGRGATDMKGGVAAMCAAAVRAVDAGLDGEIVICAVTDEEFRSAGTTALLSSGIRASAAIVTEPTCMAIAPSHKGFVWFDVTVTGRAAHGSRYDVGVDAIRNAGLLLAELDLLERNELTKRTHELLGRASLHASLIEGGIGMSTYPDRCVLKLERRTIPGETTEDALQQMKRACDAVRARTPDFSADITVEFAQAPSDVRRDAPIVAALDAAMRAEGERSATVGLSAWTDAALLNAAGIPAICYGPGDIALAHAAEEYVEIAEIERACRVLTRLALDWSAGGKR
jgi:acetylornithine deacetylase